ncbi:efflux RND transporter periplasmic adaptor subunit [Thalassomonas haliotis]|uniref:HlyD family efflux transporter periplasmic adaptor subunit n=1 Tax=Thalassomonas haliotis TaxID=485448 RepID=A0ABY7VFM8_9GAMM|nr:HlyD family efflux transporter periplasmic adaptor subunit [Thalassomonas haliotis]WDE11816.1 HlyD family efflux transporter periplasmic adaptor subunit [Thalassomonas haliotis]
MRSISFCLLLLVLQVSAAQGVPDYVAFPATVYTKQTIVLTSEQSGQILSVLDTGQTFNKGELLFQLESDYETRLLALLHEENDILKNKQKTQENLLKNYDRLFDEKLISEELQAAKLINYYNSQALLNNNRQEVTEIQWILDKKSLYAPFSGVVLERYALPVESVRAGDAIMKIANPNELFIKLKIPAGRLDKLDFRQGATLVHNSHSTALELDYLVPQIDAKSNTVEVSYKAPETALLLGQNVQLKLKKLN